ncbi:MAG: protoporphyrinogen oxidase [Simkaniaceae bacterium]|nr:protoporphyrinogen oxidase [Simkaniaceae bacterium]
MKIGILGGGISGLSHAFYLKKKGHDVTVYEKTDELGGCIKTSYEPYFFERGPRTFMVDRGESLLQVIQEVGLSSELIFATRKTRYLYYGGKLRGIPKHYLIPSLFSEWSRAKGAPDESIASFGYRRLGKKVTDYLLEPMTLGIFAGDIHKLSVKTCFPQLKEMEEQWGSLSRGFLNRKKQKKDGRLFTLKRGMGSLIQRLKEEVNVVTGYQGEALEVDVLIKALPPRLMDETLPMNSLTTVNMAFDTPVLRKEGFGYLVPTVEQEPILGAIFDSSVFPQQNKTPFETRITVMVKEPNRDIAIQTVKRHLGIEKDPIYVQETHYPNALPEFPVGHLETPFGQTFRSMAVNSLVKRGFDYAENPTPPLSLCVNILK